MFNAVLKRPGLPGEVVEFNSPEELERLTECQYKTVLLGGVCLFFEVCGAGFALANANSLQGRPFNVAVGDIRYFGDVILCAADSQGVLRQPTDSELKEMRTWL